jgi:methylmalonyl-CoA/ethylmalonyl-CoA epimerase
MIKGLRLVSIAVPNLAEALQFYRDTLGLPIDPDTTDPHHALKVAQLRIGETAVTLMQPTGEGEGPVGRFVENGGSGLYHLGLEVDDIELALRTILARGGDVLDREPRPAPDGGRIAFVRPHGQRGVLIELWEPPASSDPATPESEDEK